MGTPEKRIDVALSFGEKSSGESAFAAVEEVLGGAVLEVEEQGASREQGVSRGSAIKF